jgi:hypothetical protein
MSSGVCRLVFMLLCLKIIISASLWPPSMSALKFVISNALLQEMCSLALSLPSPSNSLQLSMLSNGNSPQIYGPCAGQDRQNFIEWFNSLQIEDAENWLFIGDFNFYRSLEDRNRGGDNMQGIMIFNEAINNLGLQEIPLKGRNYTWTNMQQDPLLEQIDWCFTSLNWISAYPNTLMLPLSRPTSNHTPYMVQIQTSIPKAQVFRFENFWIDQPCFIEVVQSVWQSEIQASNSATRLTAKFKLLRKVLKRWARGLSRLKEQIKICNEILSIMDKLEENRTLFVQERNFRNILKKHILKLLQHQKEYWKQRYTVRWTKLGDESTRFFHAAATERYRINTIPSLDIEDGRTVSEHLEKAALLWHEYKNRLGTSSHTHMHFNHLIQPHDLQGIATPFTKKDIDDIIKIMSCDKAPGTDEFNGKFLKKCWHIIREDVYGVCLDFFNGTVDIEAINNSFITLIPKVNNPSSVNDSRPISLLKIITKLPGDRLQSVIIPLVHKNQYDFIKSRTIQDYLAWPFKYIYQCQQSKREIVIIKLDFTKTFDTIEHQVILQMMQSYGFHDN